MRENMEKSFELVLGHEGQYVDDPNDPGGPTKWGVTQRRLSVWRGHNVTKQDVKNLTKTEAIEIYRVGYWDKIGADDMESGLDYAAFDFAIHSGPGRAGRHLVSATGKTAKKRINNYVDARMEYLRGLPHWDRYGKGWTNRIEGQPGRAGVRANALGMAKGEDVAEPDKIEIPGWSSWDNDRRIIALGQLKMEDDGIDPGVIDGLMGRNTEAAIARWSTEYVKNVGGGNGGGNGGGGDHNLRPNDWPRQRDVSSFYGGRGQNQKVLESPYPMRLAWDTSTVVNRWSIHEKCHDSAKRIYEAVLAHYGMDEIRRLRLDLWAGCLNVRQITGGGGWSMHSWGIAVDTDSANNRYSWDKSRATLAGPEYEAWWSFWEAESWVSLGRERDFDWMHVQAARL